MDWANERYVRLYVRKTAQWLRYPWQARAVLPLLMMEADRSGVIQVDSTEDLAFLIGQPDDVVAVAVDALCDGDKPFLVRTSSGFTIRNFYEAQEVRQSDKQRQQDSRERRRARELSSTPPTEVAPQLSLVDDDEVPPPPEPATARTKSKKAAHPDRDAATQAFHAMFEKRHGRAPEWGYPRIAKVDGLVRRHGKDEFLRRAGVMFSCGKWPAEHGGDLDTLVKHFDKFTGSAKSSGRSPISVAIEEAGG